MLNKHFGKIVMITLKGAEARANRSIAAMLDRGLIESEADIVVHIGIRGDELPPPAWWRAGGGAWGCLSSHVRVLQDAWQDGVESVLVLEDDVCWVDDASERIDEIMADLSLEWGQIYFGGQHNAAPEVLCDHWMAGASINRTHAYAASRGTIPAMLQHILYAPDYIESSYVRHIDHQLEIAHRRGDWNVLTPHYWLAGQDENDSQINGRHHPVKWWDWLQTETVATLPVVVLEKEQEYDPSITYLHEGWEATLRHSLSGAVHSQVVRNALSKVYREAWECRRLPAIRLDNPELIEARRKLCPQGLIPFRNLSSEAITALLDPKKFAMLRKPVK